MLELLIAPISGILNKFIPDADTRAKLSYELATLSQKHAQELAKGQIEINKTEAAHRSVFVSGWRPFLGWCLSFAMAWHFVIAPMTMFVCAYLKVEIPVLPVFDMDSLMTVLLGMLGLGGLRTAEKIKGITK